MPPVSPCGRVVDFLRSCARGFWRFFPNQPDVLTPGYHYFAPEDTHAINGPHSFGSAVWQKDGITYPEYPTGQLYSAGTQWYNGQAPEPIPPDQQIFESAEFSTDLPFPPSPVVDVINGFDARCFVVHHPGVDIDVDQFLRPDITDCCWQRFLARLLELLVDENPGDLATFHAAVSAMWVGFAVVVFPADTSVDRWAWIDGPHFQILLRVGTQSFQEIFSQVFHLAQPPRDFGAFRTSPEWFGLSTQQNDSLNALGWDPNKPITFVGHSRGGVVQWILARRILGDDETRDVEVLTFGVPKPGDTRMVDEDGIRRVRHVVHRQDPIPLLPPPRSLFPLLQIALDWLDVNPWIAWRPFPIYQITGDGWGNGMQAAADLPVDTVIAWLTLLRNGREVVPIMQHYLSSYVAALADCCDKPEFPFTQPIWDIVFGDANRAPGGGMVGGFGVLPWTSGSSGLALGGGLPFYIGRDGLKIGGSGSSSFSETYAIITEDDWYILTESSDLILRE